MNNPIEIGVKKPDLKKSAVNQCSNRVSILNSVRACSRSYLDLFLFPSWPNLDIVNRIKKELKAKYGKNLKNEQEIFGQIREKTGDFNQLETFYEESKTA